MSKLSDRRLSTLIQHLVGEKWENVGSLRKLQRDSDGKYITHETLLEALDEDYQDRHATGGAIVLSTQKRLSK